MSGDPDDLTVRVPPDSADRTQADFTARTDLSDATVRADPPEATQLVDPAEATMLVDRAEATVRVDPADLTRPDLTASGRTRLDSARIDQSWTGADRANPARTDATRPIPARDDSAGYTVPEYQRTTPTSYGSASIPSQATPSNSVPSQPMPAPLPQRVPGQAAVPSPSSGGTGGSGQGTGTGTSIRIGKGVGPAPRRNRDYEGGFRLFLGRATRVLSAIATVILIAAAAWTGWQWWEHLHNKVAVSAVAVAPAQVLDGQCDVQFDIVGTIATNGKAGKITYQWLRSDGQNSGTLTQTVSAGATSTTVHLYWKFTGEGSMDASATLHVLTPNVADGQTKFRYSCA